MRPANKCAPMHIREWESVMKEFRLNEKEMNELADRIPTPFMVVSLEKIRENYEFLKSRLPQVRVFYAIKANPAEPILRHMVDMGASFDVASSGEIRQLHDLGVDGDRMIYANPVKDRRGLEAAAECGVNKFTFDDESELFKMAEYVPGGRCLVRIKVKNQRAVVDLNEKFGTDPADALPLLRKAKAMGLKAEGICFHVGSQSLTSEAYGEALLLCRRLFDEAEAEGMKLTTLDIGGGFPVPSLENPQVDLKGMMDGIRRQLDRLFPEVEIWSEPGRYICGTAANLVTTVIGTKKRNGQPWYVLDDGLYGCLNGTLFDHWTFPLEFFKAGGEKASTFVGPSCDSIDVVRRDIMAPRLQVGDRIMVPNCGAYTNAAATTFNGFEKAQIVVWEQEAAELSNSMDIEEKQLIV